MSDQRADDSRFAALRESLLRAGIAARTVRRAMLEIGGHFDLLVRDATSRGTPEPEARAAAHDLIGSNRVLLERYAARPELHAWCHRWPRVYFMTLPIASYLAMSAAVMGVLLLTMHFLTAYLHQTRVSPAVSHGIETTAHLVFLWVLPSMVGTAFAVLARRHRIALRWPLAGIVLLGAFASLADVDVVITGGPKPGYAGAGLGLSTESILDYLIRTSAVTALVYVTTWLAVRRLARDRLASAAPSIE